MKKNEKKVPFFAQFLESQLSKQANGGRIKPDITDSRFDEVYVTLKFPSDSDEITDSRWDDFTDKFPSDSDEITSPKMDKC